MILVNILALVAIAATAVALMLTGQEADIHRTTRFAEAARADAAVAGGELSARVALRRDALLAPEADHPREPWGAVNQAAIAIEGGTFSLQVQDAQGRLNLLDVARGDPGALQALARIAAALGIPPATQAAVAARLRQGVGPEVLAELPGLGIDPALLPRLAQLVTILPATGGTPINLNAIDPALLAILTDTPAGAQQLLAQRDRAGLLTSADLQTIGVPTPPGTGFTSDHYWVRTNARIGDTTRAATALLQRRRAPDGVVTVETIGRWRGGTRPF